MSIHESELQTSVESVSRSTLKVGDKVIEGFYVAYVQKLFGKSATTSLDKKGMYTLSKRVNVSDLVEATEAHLQVIVEFDAFDKADQAYRRMKDAKYSEFRKRLGKTW